MDEDTTLSNYQDDFDTTKPDNFANETGDLPAEELGIPEAELKKELDDLDGSSEDMRETIEDRDEDDDNAASNA